MTPPIPSLGTVRENSNALVSGLRLLDESGAGVGTGQLTTLTLTLYLKGSPSTYINGRNAQDALNANGVTVDAIGNVTWQMSYLDNPLVGEPDQAEEHVALFEWTWSGGTKKGNAERLISVIPVVNVP